MLKYVVALLAISAFPALADDAVPQPQPHPTQHETPKVAAVPCHTLSAITVYLADRGQIATQLNQQIAVAMQGCVAE